MGSSIYHRQSLESIITPRHIAFFKIPNFPPEIGAPNGTPNLRLIQTPRVREKASTFCVQVILRGRVGNICQQLKYS